MQPRTLELPGVDGVRLHALEWSSAGVPLVFVHGFGNDAHVWDEIAPHVAAHYRTLAITLRGHGDSGRSEEPGRGGDALARDVEAALDSLGVKRVVLVGHSLGGRVCTQLAGRDPDRVAGLVLVDFAPELDSRGTTRIREETRDQTRRADPSFASPEEYLRVLERQYPVAARDTLVKLAEHWTRRRPDGRYELKLDLRAPSTPRGEIDADAADRMRERARQDVASMWETLRKLPCPTLVVRGAASDVLSADVAERLAEDELKQGKLVEIPRASHSVMLDNPKDFTRVLTDFVLG